MVFPLFLQVLLAFFTSVLFGSSVFAAILDSCEDVRYQSRPRLFVLTDIGADPDDQMSLVRLLTHSNELQIQGISATTSVWKNDSVGTEYIFGILDGYSQVTENLNKNVPESGKYPSAEDVSSRVYSGHPVYGLDALDLPLSNASLALIDATDASSESDPLWVTAWGGIGVLAEALNHVQQSRSDEETTAFAHKLRVYTISDQDDAGPWIRLNFPALFYIVSIHGYNDYSQATWNGMSGDVYRSSDVVGADTSLVTNDWLQEHIRIGPLGAHYPDLAYSMEGDTPSFQGLLPNGLNAPEHPEWGGWGGRYVPIDASGRTRVFGNTADFAIGLNGDGVFSNFASIWRWRRHFQNDFAARMQWTVNPKDANHHPVVVVNDTCALESLEIPYRFGDSVVLDASASYDPDGDNITFTWFHYREVAQSLERKIPLVSPNVSFTSLDPSGSVVSVRVNNNITAHIILSVEDSRPMNLTSYKRIILNPIV